jgi:L-ascorbate metabolism protein UlaG (beta-lactamase superfamily)
MNNLAREIAGASPLPSAPVFWRLGQAGIALRMAGKLLLLDPFFSPVEDRLIPSPIGAGDLPGIDYVVGTHDHIDHIDRVAWPLLAKTVPGAKFLVPGLLLEALSGDLGIPPDRFIPLDDEKTVEEAGLRFTGIAAAHELLNRDQVTGRCPCISVVIEGAGRRIFHAGDACPYEGLETRLRRAGPLDIMFLPINGRDAVRLRKGIIGNFLYQEAAELAGALRPALAVPVHYDMVIGNLGDPELFTEYLSLKFPGIPSRICQIGEAVTV